jgi:hypothetical protein
LRIYHVESIPTSYVISPEAKVAAASPEDVQAVVTRLLK